MLERMVIHEFVFTVFHGQFAEVAYNATEPVAPREPKPAWLAERVKPQNTVSVARELYVLKPGLVTTIRYFPAWEGWTPVSTRFGVVAPLTPLPSASGTPLNCHWQPTGGVPLIVTLNFAVPSAATL